MSEIIFALVQRPIANAKPGCVLEVGVVSRPGDRVLLWRKPE